MVSLATFSALTATIHEAALVPERWGDVLGGAMAEVGASLGGIIAGPTPQHPGMTVATGTDSAFVRSYETHYGAIDPIVPAVQRMPPGTVLTHGMVVPAPDMVRTEFYNDWARPQGIHDCLVAKFMSCADAGVICLATSPGGLDFTSEVLASCKP